MSGTRRRWLPFVLVALAAALLRAVYLLAHARTLPFLRQPVRDSAWFDAWARSLAAGQPFGSGPFFHAPGYAWFLAGVYRVLGPHPIHAVIIQALLGVAITILVMVIARRLFGERESLLAGILMLGAGPLLFFESKLLAEPLAVPLAALAWLLCLPADRGVPVPMSRDEARSLDRAIADGQRPAPAPVSARVAAAAAGAVAGCLVVVRPDLLPVPVLITLVLLGRAARRLRPWSTGLLYAAGFVAALLPTSMHNMAAGAAAPVSTGFGVELFLGSRPEVGRVYEPVPGFSGPEGVRQAEADSLVRESLGRPLPPGPQAGYWVARAVAEVGRDPAAWLALLGRKTWLLVTRQEDDIEGSFALEMRRLPPLRVSAIPFNFFVVAGLVGLGLAAGLAGARRGSCGSLVAPAALLVTVAVSALLFPVSSRLRLVALPVLAVLSAHALARADQAWRGGQRRRVLVLLLGGVVLLAATWRSPAGPPRNAAREARLLVEAGAGLEARGDLPAAARAWEEALDTDPENLDALVQFGQLAMKNHDLAEAMRWFERARDAAPGSFAVRNNLGILYYEARRFDLCERELKTASALAPDEPGPHFYRGLAARQQGDSTAAEALFREALDRDPRFVGAYVRLIEMLLARGAAAEAQEWADRAAGRAVALPSGLALRLRQAGLPGAAR